MKKILAFDQSRPKLRINHILLVENVAKIREAFSLLEVDMAPLLDESTSIFEHLTPLNSNLTFLDSDHSIRLINEIEQKVSQFGRSLDKFISKNSLSGQHVDQVIASFDIIDEHLLNLIPEAYSDSDTSGSSVRSLGDFLPKEVKDILDDYQWGRSDWRSGSDFRRWVESESPLPKLEATLNCWEAANVVLNTLELLDKAEIRDAFVNGKSMTFPDGTPKAMSTDADIIANILGLWKKEYEGDPDNIQPGDIIIFDTAWTEMAHVAIALEQTSKEWLFSFWTMPEKGMIKVTKNQIVLAFNREISEPLHKVKTSTKFRGRASEVLT